MSSEELRTHLQEAIDHVVASGMSVDEADVVFAEYQDRLEQLRQIRGDA